MTTTLPLAEAILAAGRGRRSMVRCSAHEDRNASLSVGPGDTQPVVLQCFAGCETADILAAEGIDWSEIMAKDPTELTTRVWTPAGDASHVYSYCDEEGTEVLQVLRVPTADGKTFRQRHWSSEESKWLWTTRDCRRPLYRLPEVMRGIEGGHTIWWMEGEKDVEAARLDGLVATCNPMGAGKWEDEWAESLREATVVIVTDADEPGRAHARYVADQLVEAGCDVQVRESMIGKDYHEHRAKGGTADSLTVVWRSRPEARANFGMGIQDFLRQDWKEDDELIPGYMARSNVTILTGWEGHGKLVDLSTTLLTPDGSTTMGEVKAGDRVLGSDGKPCTVVYKSPEQMDDVHYRVHLSDGTTVDAGMDHQWVTWTLEAREAESRRRRKVEAGGSNYTPKHLPQVRTTQQIVDTLVHPKGVTNHAILASEPLDLPEAHLPVGPYTFGAWLGDGNSDSPTLAIAERDSDILIEVAAEGYQFSTSNVHHSCRRYRILGQMDAWRATGALGDKHIPMAYLRASRAQREALLAGICDTDGYMDPRGQEAGKRGSGCSTVEVTFTTERLARDTAALAATLGVIPRVYEGEAKIGDKSYGTKWRVCFQSPFNPFRRAAFKRDRWRPLSTARSTYRYIVKVEEIERRPMACIQVDSPDSTYLITDRAVVTHNTTFMRQMAVCAAGGVNPFEMTSMEPLRVLYIDAENPEHQQVFDWRKLAGLVAHHTGQPVPNENLFILSEWENEPDLLTTPGQAWLYERVQAYRPDLVLMGPAQNLVQRDLSDDNVVRKLKHAVNTARAMCGSAFVIEHHSPWKQQGDKERSVRPYGSSLFNKWPDFGYGLRPDPDRPGHYDLVPNRNPRVRRRAWPEAFRWGRPNSVEFPWMVAEPSEAGSVVVGGFGGSAPDPVFAPGWEPTGSL